MDCWRDVIGCFDLKLYVTLDKRVWRGIIVKHNDRLYNVNISSMKGGAVLSA
jgi:hypothetical protein